LTKDNGIQAPSWKDGFMLKFGHSRHRALGDFKRTWRDDKTTCGVFWRSVKESSLLEDEEVCQSTPLE